MSAAISAGLGGCTVNEISTANGIVHAGGGGGNFGGAVGLSEGALKY